MAKLIRSQISLPIFSLVATVRALLQNSTNKKWMVAAGTDAEGEAGDLAAILDGGSNVKLYSLSPTEDFSDSADWESIAITVDGREKIKFLHDGINLATLYKTPETVYFKHLGEFIDGIVKGKFPALAGCRGIMIDQNTPSLWVVPGAENMVTLDSPGVFQVELEPDAPAGDFGE